MANFVTLDNVLHSDLKVTHQYGEEYGARVNQVRAFITEFEDLQREYPILFRKTDTGEFYAVCILGLDANENLFLDDNIWTGRYVPAALRRGPFKIGLAHLPGQEATPNIMIDTEDPRVGTAQGLALFEPSGGLTPYLNQISHTLRVINVGMRKEAEFFLEIEKLSLIKPITLEIKVSEEKGYAIPDVFTIDQERLIGLDASDLQRINQSRLLSLCYSVVSSMGNTNNLLERKLRQTLTGNS